MAEMVRSWPEVYVRAPFYCNFGQKWPFDLCTWSRCCHGQVRDTCMARTRVSAGPFWKCCAPVFTVFQKQLNFKHKSALFIISDFWGQKTAVAPKQLLTFWRESAVLRLFGLWSCTFEESAYFGPFRPFLIKNRAEWLWFHKGFTGPGALFTRAQNALFWHSLTQRASCQ